MYLSPMNGLRMSKERVYISVLLCMFLASCAATTKKENRYQAKLDELRQDRSVKEFKNAGWSKFTIENRREIVIWVFTPDGHFAHPSFVERKAKRDEDGSWSVQTHLTCGARSGACEQYLQEYDRLDRKLRNELGGNRSEWL